MNIFVANLNFKTKEESLEAVFAKYGEVLSVKIVKEKERGRSKGFGFVEISDDESGQKAIAELNGTELDGRAIVVKLANSKPTS